MEIILFLHHVGPSIELRLSGLVANAFTCKITQLTLSWGKNIFFLKSILNVNFFLMRFLYLIVFVDYHTSLLLFPCLSDVPFGPSPPFHLVLLSSQLPSLVGSFSQSHKTLSSFLAIAHISFHLGPPI